MTFFDRAKACVMKIILRKIFSCPNDEIGIILFGAEESQNSLNNSQFEFEGIKELGSLECPNWQMLRKIDKIEIAMNSTSNWIEALLVGLNYAQDETK